MQLSAKYNKKTANGFGRIQRTGCRMAKGKNTHQQQSIDHVPAHGYSNLNYFFRSCVCIFSATLLTVFIFFIIVFVFCAPKNKDMAGKMKNNFLVLCLLFYAMIQVTARTIHKRR